METSNPAIESSTSRGGFLRRLGMMAAIGLGVSMATAAAASAANQCCPAECGASCPPDRTEMECFDSCTGNSCCVCSTQGGCHNVPCPCP